jgi:NADH-ubiquinone oxidoreductase chain 1
MLPLFVIFFIASVAETNRPPFDLTECESELVSGHMTELSATSFVFFFLAEYTSIVYMCVLTSLLYLGGYLGLSLNYDNYTLELLLNSFNLGLKSSMLMYTFI